MDTTQLEADLLLRIEQSRGWLEKNPVALTGFKFKKDTDWEALPIKFLDDPKRVERYGVRFRFYVVNYTENIEVELDVRIHPTAEVKAKGDSHPYVIIYVVDQQTGGGVEIAEQEFERPGFYADLIGLSIEDWYRFWIERALKNRSSSRILRPAMAVTMK